MRRPLAPLAVLLALAAAGCGATPESASDFDGEERRVAQAVDDLAEAARDDDAARICRDLLSAELARSAGDCDRAVASAIDDADSTALTTKDVTITGDRARARIVAGADEKDRDEERTLELVREGGRWRFASLGAA